MGALDDLKVADFAWILAGSQVGRCLADFGATVVRLESEVHPDLFRTMPPYKDGVLDFDHALLFANTNCNKYSMALDLRHPRAGEVLKRLVGWSDVVVENFTPGVMESWGLSYEQLRSIKPDVIMLSISNAGQTGPRAQQPGFVNNSDALAGYYELTGWPDREPTFPQAIYGDVLTPRLALCALLAALHHRRRTGEGQRIDSSQLEASAFCLSPLLLQYFANGNWASREGNRCSWAAPQGVFQCAGEDRWIAISATTDEQWQGLCQAMGEPALCDDSKFSTLLGRKTHEDELEARIEVWTRGFAAEELMQRLQSQGVPSAVVSNNQDISVDPQLQHRQAFWHLEHPVIGRHSCDTFSFNLSATPAEARMAGPCFGEHTEYVCSHLLGIAEEDFLDLLNDGVFR